MPEDAPQRYEPPEPGRSDRLTAALAAIGKALPLPFAGELATELLDALVGPSLSRRQQEWRASVARALVELEERGRVDLAALTEDEAFVSTVLLASRSALLAHQEEKLAALRNAVLNVAAGVTIEDVRREMLLALVDRLTVAHIQVLKWAEVAQREGLASAIHREGCPAPIYKTVTGREPPGAERQLFFSRVVWLELKELHLAWDQGVRHKEDAGPSPPLLTGFGYDFLQFIEAP